VKALVSASAGIESVPEKLPVASRRSAPPISETSVSFTMEVSTPPLMVPSRSIKMITWMTSGTRSGRSGTSSDFTRQVPVASGSCANVVPGVVLDMTTSIDREAGVPKPRVSVPTMRVTASAPSWTTRPSNAELSLPTPRVPVRWPSGLTRRLPGRSPNDSFSAVDRLPAVTIPPALKVTVPLAKAAPLSTATPTTRPRMNQVPLRSEAENWAAAGEARESSVRDIAATRIAVTAPPVLRRQPPCQRHVAPSCSRLSPGRPHPLSPPRRGKQVRPGTLSDKPISVKAELASGEPESTLYTPDGKEPSPNEEPGYIRDGHRPVSGQPPGGLGGTSDRHGS